MSIPLSANVLLEKIEKVWLPSLSSIRALGERHYHGDDPRRVHEAYGAIRMLGLPDAPTQPAEPEGGWTIGAQIEELERVRDFLRRDAYLPADSPSMCAKHLGMSLKTLKRKRDAGQIRVKMLSQKSWQIHRTDAATFGYSP